MINTITATILQHYMTYCQHAKRLLVGYSGGVDSQVLLLELTHLRSQLACEVIAIHVNHGLHPQADVWQHHCEQICTQLQIPLIAEQVGALQRSRDGLEAAARQARYQAFAQAALPGDVVVLAHHQQDQAETALFRLLRGTGIHGMSGMRHYVERDNLSIFRPLLSVAKPEILQRAAYFAKPWIEDPSNQDESFSRNYLRHKVLSLLQSRWPAAVRQIQNFTQHCSEASELLTQLAALDLAQVKHTDSNTLQCEQLLKLPFVRQKNLLKYWLEVQGFVIPTQQILKQIITDCVQASDDRQPKLCWGSGTSGIEVRRFNHLLYALKPLAPIVSQALTINWQPLSQSKLAWPGGGYLTATVKQGRGVKVKLLEQQELIVGFRQGGERIQLTGSKHHRKLKHLLQELLWPPWRRERMPLCYWREQLLVIPNVGIRDGFQALSNESGVEICWIYD